MASGDSTEIFDEESSNVIEEKQWSQLKDSRIKDGFREGISQGQESSLQQGFDEGFTNAAMLCFKLATLRGMLSGILSHQTSGGKILSTDMKLKIETSISQLSDLETKVQKEPVQQIPACDQSCDCRQAAGASCSQENTCGRQAVSSSIEESMAQLKSQCQEILNQCGYNIDFFAVV